MVRSAKEVKKSSRGGGESGPGSCRDDRITEYIEFGGGRLTGQRGVHIDDIAWSPGCLGSVFNK